MRASVICDDSGRDLMTLKHFSQVRPLTFWLTLNGRSQRKSDTISGFPDHEFLYAGNTLESLGFDNEDIQHFVNFGKWLPRGHFDFFGKSETTGIIPVKYLIKFLSFKFKLSTVSEI